MVTPEPPADAGPAASTEPPLVVPLDSSEALDPTLVGGKAASLARLRRLVASGGLGTGGDAAPIVPDGFVVTTEVHRRIGGDSHSSDLPDELAVRIAAELSALGDRSGGLEGLAGQDDAHGPGGDRERQFAVRSSAVAEDAPGASFAGLHDSVLGVADAPAVREAYRRVLASLHSERAVAYRRTVGQHADGALMAVLVQPLVRADLGGVAGVVFSRDPDRPTASAWDPGAVVIEAVAGLGDAVVGGSADHRTGTVGTDPAATGLVSPALRARLVRLAGELDAWTGGPVDVEWAVDGRTGQLALLQLRPLAVRPERTAVPDAGASGDGVGRSLRCTGFGIGHGSVTGRVRRLDDPLADDAFDDGDVLVTAHTDPAWLPLMQRAGAIVTDMGGRTSHAAIVSRELGLLAVVGCGDATTRLPDDSISVVECDGKGHGVVYGDDAVAEVRRPEA